MLLSDGDGKRLYTVASHGFDHTRFGAEIAIGEGIYGTSAARKLSIRTGSMRREMLLAEAVARESSHADPTYLPLPRLAEAESSRPVPLLSGERCLGVLCFQSATSGAFTARLEKTLLIIARQLTLCMTLLGVGAKDVEVSAQRGPLGSRALRILWRVLSNYTQEQREEFSSKEIRLDPELGLPALKDDLEARLIALRKRLLERTTVLCIEKTGRGRFRLEVGRE